MGVLIRNYAKIPYIVITAKRFLILSQFQNMKFRKRDPKQNQV